MSELKLPAGTTVYGDVFSGDKYVVDTGGGDYYEAAALVGVPALHQLPPPPAGFTGRAAELETLRGAAKGAARIGLRGLGGVGKTALALVLAHELAADYPDAQIFLDLQGVTRPLTAEAAMAHAIRAFRPVEKLPDDPAQLAAIYQSVLSGQRAVLLLDNAAGAGQIRPLLPPPGCVLIVTSRQKFALPGLKTINLDSLPPAEAEALLLALAERIGAQAGALAALCGGLPLALTLAGSALAEREDLEPEAYAQRLAAARLGVLDEVAASLGLSAGLLGAELQAAWPMLAAFPAEFDAAGAASVWDQELEPAAERVSELLRYSLVEFDAARKRYHLHDLAREFCRARLSEAERATAARRHAGHYLMVLAAAQDAYTAGGEKIGQALALFDQERANILAGQAWAAGRAAQDPAAAQLTSEYAGRSFDVLYLRQSPREKLAWIEAALAAARGLGNEAAEAVHLGNLGVACSEQGELGRATEYLEQALALDRKTHNLGAQMAELTNLGNVYRRLGEPARAIEYLEQALAVNHKLADRRAEGAVLGNLGTVYHTQGEFARAAEYYQRQLAIAQALGDRMGEARALGNWGNAQGKLGDPHGAIQTLAQSLAIDRALGNRAGQAVTLSNLGRGYIDLDQAGPALGHFAQAAALERELGDAAGLAADLGSLGALHLALGETGPAIAHYAEQLALWRGLGQRAEAAMASWNLGLAYGEQGELARAIEAMQACVDYERETGSAEVEADAARVEALRQRLAGG